MWCNQGKQECVFGVIVIEGFMIDLATCEEYAASCSACFLVSEHVCINEMRHASIDEEMGVDIVTNLKRKCQKGGGIPHVWHIDYMKSFGMVI